MRFFAVIGLVAILLAIGSALYFFGGYYNVAAAQPDNSTVAWAIGQVREASIESRAPATAPVNLEEPSLIEAGAGAFAARGCATCHGAPGATWAKFAGGMRPVPADLTEVAKSYAPGAIFWVIKNGLNMTGMPSFGRIKVQDSEIWAITAFVKKLPSVSPDDYKKWAAAGAP